MNMQKYRFSNPASVVEVSLSPLDRPEPGSPYKIFDCLCRLFGRNRKGPHKTYQVTATTPAQAARFAIEKFRKEYGTEQPNI